MADVFLKHLLCQLMRGEGGCIDALGFRVWGLPVFLWFELVKKQRGC